MPFSGYAYDPGYTSEEIKTADFRLCDPWGTTTNITEYGFGDAGLTLEGVTEVVRSKTQLKVQGKVKNNSDAPINGVRVVAAFFDHKGRYVGYEQDFSLGGVAIPAGKTGRFSIDARAGGSSITTALEFIDGRDYTYDLWVARDSQTWFTC